MWCSVVALPSFIAYERVCSSHTLSLASIANPTIRNRLYICYRSGFVYSKPTKKNNGKLQFMSDKYPNKEPVHVHVHACVVAPNEPLSGLVV
jgi:hypothetical protein